VDAALHFYRDVLPLARAQFPELKFVIAGRSPAPAVRRLARDPGVCVTGAVADMKPYIAGASVAVAPLRVARGVQNKALEAMALGVPVVASSAVAAALPPDLAAHCAVEDQPAAIAQKIVNLLRTRKAAPDGDLRAAVVAHFGTPDLHLQLENILQQSAREAQPSPVAGRADTLSLVMTGEEKRPVSSTS
jgi:glycosyltransferase involved in cell wall biosynthesis